MIKIINDINYLFIAFFICVFPPIIYPKMLQASTAPKYFLMMIAALILATMILITNITKDIWKDSRIGYAMTGILAMSLLAIFPARSSFARGDLTALFGVENTGYGIVLLLCAGVFFIACRALKLDEISRKNLLWFYAIGINISLIISAFGKYYASVEAELGLADLQLGTRSAFSDQTTFLIFVASLFPILIGLLILEKNRKLRLLTFVIFLVDLAATVLIISDYHLPGGHDYWLQMSNSIAVYFSSGPTAMIFGSGFGSYENVYFHAVRAHTFAGDIHSFPQLAPNMVLETIITYGLVGLSLLIFLIFYFAKYLFRSKKGPHRDKFPFLYAVSAAALAFLISFFVVPANFQLIIMFAIFLGLAVGNNAASEYLPAKKLMAEVPSTAQNYTLTKSKARLSAIKSSTLIRKARLITISALFVIISTLAISSTVALKNIRTDIAFFKADKKDDLQQMRHVAGSDPINGYVTIAVARYIIFEGFASKDDKHIEEGFAVLERFSRKRPDELNILNEITNNSFLVNDYDKAIRTLRMMNRVDPQSSNILLGSGFAYFKKGDLDKSLIYYKRALAINDKKSITYFMIRDVYLKRGDKTKAGEFDAMGKDLQ